MTWLNPWREIERLRRELGMAQRLAEVWRSRALASRASAEALRRDADAYRIERDEAWAKQAIRSDAIARGNPTRRLRRNGGLLPAPINDHAHTGDQRNTSTG